MITCIANAPLMLHVYNTSHTSLNLQKITPSDPEHKVSPGPLSEAKFVSTIVPGSEYLLPQYVTGLLLTRNVEIEFTGVSASYASHAVRVASSSSFSGGFGFWKASVSHNSGSYSRQVKSEQTASGLRITIPGAQVIGYFTQVLPVFPQN